MTSEVHDPTITALIERTIDTKVAEPFGAYLFLDGDPAAEMARSVERSVFLDAFGNTPELLAQEYGAYEEASMFICVVDHRQRRAAGAVRLILPTPGGPGLKSLNDVEATWGTPAEVLIERLGLSVPPGGMWDVATLSVDPAYRSAAATGLVSLGLYQSFVRIALAAGIEWLCAILDTVVYRMTRVRFASPFVPYAEGREYLGSDCLPVVLDIPSWSSRIASFDPIIHDIIVDGVGLEPALRPLPLEVASALSGRLLTVASPH